MTTSKAEQERLMAEVRAENRLDHSTKGSPQTIFTCDHGCYHTSQFHNAQDCIYRCRIPRDPSYIIQGLDDDLRRNGCYALQDIHGYVHRHDVTVVCWPS